MATIAKKCSVCGALYRAYNYVDIPVSREDDDDQEYDDDEAIDVEVEEDFEPINFEPNGFEFVTIKEDMDIQYDFDNQDLCPECMEAISNFIDTNTPKESGNPVVLYDAAPANAVSVEVTGGNENTIIVRTSKNLARFCPEDNTDAAAFNYEVNEPNNIVCTKTSSAGKFFAVFKAYLKKDVTYKFSHTINSLAVWLYSNKIWGEQITNFTIGEEGKTYTSDRTGEIVIGCWCPGSATNRVLTDFMICVDTPPLVLRGIPKLDANNNLYYDGDTYESDGTVTRKFGIIDLGNLNYGYSDNGGRSFFIANVNSIPNIKRPVSNGYAFNGLVSGYKIVPMNATLADKNIACEGQTATSSTRFIVVDNSYTDAATFKTAMSGVMLVYELATSTKENAKSFLNPQKVSKYGTEEYVTTGIVPVGHVTKYPVGSQENIDQTPYLYRVSGGGVEVGTVEEDSIVGGTVAFNQLVQNGNFESDTLWTDELNTTHSIANGILTLTTKIANNGVRQNGFACVAGHKYVICAESKCDEAKRIAIGASVNFGVSIQKDIGSAWTAISAVVACKVSSDKTLIYIYGRNTTLTNAQVRNFCIFDLTQMFGSTIADYIYSLEQSSTGAGVAFFRKLFPKDYYEYNTGELVSVEGLQSHDMVWFNQWDEEWETGTYLGSTGEPVNATSRIRSKNTSPIRVFPNTVYCFTSPSNTARISQVCWYDIDDKFIKAQGGNAEAMWLLTSPAKAYYMRFHMSAEYGATYNNDICINISSDRNGEYEPYIKHSYPLNDAWDSVYEFSNEKTYTVGDDIHLLTGSNTLTASEGTLTIKYKKAIEGKMEVES